MKRILLKLSVVLFVLALMITLFCAFQIPKTYHYAKQFGGHTEGVVEDCVWQDDSTDPQKNHWELTIQFSVDDESYWAYHELNKIENPKVGDIFKVWYNEEDPSRNCVDNNPAETLRQYVCISVVGALISILCILYMKREGDPWEILSGKSRQ